MIKPLPSMNTIYSILLSDEKQRYVSATSQFSLDFASFHAGVSKQSYPAKVAFDSHKSIVTCKYCKKLGHIIEKCFKLHGFPQNFKFTKGGGPRKAASKASVDSSGSQSVPSGLDNSFAQATPFEHTSRILGITQHQYVQLMQLLQHSYLNRDSS